MSASRVPVVAIDGPSGAGKGSAAQALARRLGFHLLDSGALYRAVALACRREAVDLGVPAAVAATVAGLDVAFRAGAPGEPASVLLGGEAVDDALRGEQCGADASRIAAYPEVRAALLERQRGFRRPPGLVADGRDMGTVVFPDADLKVFLTASVEARADRRHKQLKQKGFDVSLKSLFRGIEARDRDDRERASSPLRPAADAIEVDTTEFGIGAVVEELLALARARGIAAAQPG